MYRIKLVRFKAHDTGKYPGISLYVLRFYDEDKLLKTGLFYGKDKMYRGIMDYIDLLGEYGVDPEIKERTKFWAREDIQYYKRESWEDGNGFRLKPTLYKSDIYNIIHNIKEEKVEQQNLFA